MDFFQNQENAQRKTTLLVFYYVLAVALIILGLYAAIIIIINLNTKPEVRLDYWNPTLFSSVAGITLFIVFLGTLYKVRQLSSGGKSVAKLLGGTPIEPQTKDLKQRMLLNVVEEMSIASGVQVPRTYLLKQEEGINAFAAGFSPDDAVIGVTQGCLHKFSRDELQGVIAHEFSHILHGDMRINIKLMGVLHGILVIAFIGFTILRSTVYSRGTRRSSGKGGNPLPIILFSLAMIIIGYIGVFFGNLIKSAVSRQREYLADASAVQFTRNPAGIAGALKKIAGIKKSSQIKNSHAQEANHLFFSSNLSGFMANLLSTHPPIAERIKRVEPSFNQEIKASRTKYSSASPLSGFAGKTEKIAVNSQDVVSSVGTTQLEDINYAAQALRDIPDSLLDAAHSLTQAESIVYSLLFSKDSQIKEQQIQLLKKRATPEVYEATNNIYPEVEKLPVQYRLPLLDLTISTLKKVSPNSYQLFKDNLEAIINADGKVSLFEYIVKTIILSHLRPAFEKPSPPQVIYHNLKKLKSECSLLLSYLAHYGIDDQTKKAEAFSQAVKKIKIINSADFLSTEKCLLKDFDQVLDRLGKTTFSLKRKLIDACVTCVIADGEITTKQAELIRVTADAIGCPIPPLFPGKVRSPDVSAA
ncbi:MAG: M48 family metallopeptidase [Candidatus Omnitrophota bacterium]